MSNVREAPPSSTVIVRTECANCGAHTPARLLGERPLGRCSVCGSERLSRVGTGEPPSGPRFTRAK
jgi:DNA-directed RNA polymerase subunit RPC12/RpoP